MTAMAGTDGSVVMPTAQELTVILPFLSLQEMESLLPYLTLRAFAAGEILMQAGDPADFMGFLIAGKLAVKKETTFRGKYILVAVIEQGGLVGELAAVEKSQRKATVVAMEESRLLVLPFDAMTRLLLEKNALGVKLLKRIIHVLGHRLRQASERLSWIL